MLRNRERIDARKHGKAGPATPSRRVRRSVESGANTRERVLRVARELLITEGHANFSIRRVAEAAGITAGNLTYHFPSKRELVRALIAMLVSEYGKVKNGLYVQVSGHPKRRLETLIEWVMRDAASATTNRLFRELWAMALHDSSLARAVDDFYDVALDGLATMLRDEYRQLDAQATREMAHLIALIGEGSSVLYGTRASRKVPLERLAKAASEMVTVALHARISGARKRRGPGAAA